MKKWILPSAMALLTLLAACGTTAEVTQLSQSNPEQTTDAQTTDVQNTLQTQATSPWGGVLFQIYVENTANVSVKSQIKSAMSTIGQPFNGSIKSYWAISIAMAEEKTLNVSAWPLGFGDGKRGDAANFGIYKMNWLMLRQVLPIAYGANFNGLDQWGYDRLWPGTSQKIWQVINSNVGIATRLLYTAWSKWSVAEPVEGVKNNFWAGHRCGGTGLNFGKSCVGTESYANQVVRYYKGIHAILNYATTKYTDTQLWTTSVRIGADLFPI